MIYLYLPIWYVVIGKCSSCKINDFKQRDEETVALCHKWPWNGPFVRKTWIRTVVLCSRHVKKRLKSSKPNNFKQISVQKEQDEQNEQSVAPLLQTQCSWVTGCVGCVKHYALQAESFFSNAVDDSPVLLRETPAETTRFISTVVKMVQLFVFRDQPWSTECSVNPLCWQRKLQCTSYMSWEKSLTPARSGSQHWANCDGELAG